ncbi:MAG TPA: DUF6491 family protein [Steroidobacteraceae bacterium]|nr:DUF6491 family protein [Steroidobacteraceae bacterium]
MQTLIRYSLFAISVMAMTGAQCAQAAIDEQAKSEAPADKPKANLESCFFSRFVHDWRTLDDRNLIVWAPNNRQAYHVQLIFPLFSARYEYRLAFIDGDRDGRLCGHGRDSIGETDRSAAGQRSSITSITRLDAESIAKLEEKYKTKLTPQPRKKKTPETAETSEASQDEATH